MFEEESSELDSDFLLDLCFIIVGGGGGGGNKLFETFLGCESSELESDECDFLLDLCLLKTGGGGGNKLFETFLGCESSELESDESDFLLDLFLIIVGGRGGLAVESSDSESFGSGEADELSVSVSEFVGECFLGESSNNP